MENPFVNSAVIGLSNGEIVRNKNNVTQRKTAHLSKFVINADGLKMHFIGFQTTYY